MIQFRMYSYNRCFIMRNLVNNLKQVASATKFLLNWKKDKREAHVTWGRRDRQQRWPAQRRVSWPPPPSSWAWISKNSSPLNITRLNLPIWHELTGSNSQIFREESVWKKVGLLWGREKEREVSRRSRRRKADEVSLRRRHVTFLFSLSFSLGPLCCPLGRALFT